MGRALTSNVLGRTAFWMLNKALVKYLEGSYTAAVLLTELIYRRDSIGEEEFFVLSEDLQDALCIGEKSRRAAIKKLEETNLIRITAKPTHTADKGYQTVNWFTINDDLIETILTSEGSSSPEGGPGGRWCQKDTTVAPKRPHDLRKIEREKRGIFKTTLLVKLVRQNKSLLKTSTLVGYLRFLRGVTSKRATKNYCSCLVRYMLMGSLTQISARHLKRR